MLLVCAVFERQDLITEMERMAKEEGYKTIFIEAHAFGPLNWGSALGNEMARTCSLIFNRFFSPQIRYNLNISLILKHHYLIFSCIIQLFRCVMKSISSEAINLLRHNARSVVRELGLLNDAYFDIGVTLAERHLLIELNSCLYPTIGDIAERLLLDKSTASRLIAKAVKKGYVKYSSDENDKRKRFLQFTEKGKKTLNAFEPIAFDQTKEALLTLTPDEIEIVHRGISLYAKGLKNSRLRNKITIKQITPQDNASLAHLLADVYRSFKLFEHKKCAEWTNLFEIYQKKGFSYLVMKMESKIIGGAGIAPYPSNGTQSCLLETICIQSNMLDFESEKILIDFCIKEAKRLGYNQCYVDSAKEILFSSAFFQAQGFQSIKKNKQNGLLWKAC